MECSFSVNAITKSATLVYNVCLKKCDADSISNFANAKQFNKLCETGCLNYGKKWSCPPHSPNYRDFSVGWDNLFILYARIELFQFSYAKNDYLKVKAANSVLKSRADKFLRYVVAKYGRYISTGSCRLCKPCKCKMGQPCAHPDLMTYSFEAMGIDVDKLIIEQFQKPLLWYKPHCLPEYTSVVCGLLTNAEITAEDLKEEYLQYIMF
ncbi:MAG: DUF2284 domain-containing protein [Clostridiales bacterium]|jgi:predicted metal-binding protein|nr:DUF2284 domain-containing protein [Clostridiales bacterium]